MGDKNEENLMCVDGNCQVQDELEIVFVLIAEVICLNCKMYLKNEEKLKCWCSGGRRRWWELVEYKYKYSRLGQNPKFVKGTYCGAPLTDSLKSRDANASENPLLHLD